MILILLDAPKCSGPLWSERESQAWKRTSLRFRCFLFLELYFINGQLESQKLAFYFLFLYLCEKGESTHVSLPKLLCLYKSYIIVEGTQNRKGKILFKKLHANELCRVKTNEANTG